MLVAEHRYADHFVGTANDPASIVAAAVFEPEALALEGDRSARLRAQPVRFPLLLLLLLLLLLPFLTKGCG